jgi:hypothetical protein
MGLRAVHDILLASRPQGASHDETTCPFCLSPEGAGSDCGCGSTGAAEVAALRAEVADLHRQLDEQMVLAGRAATDAADALATAAKRAEGERRMAERASAAMAAGIPAMAVAERLEQWAAMDDDSFAMFVDGFRNLRAARPSDTIPAHTALMARVRRDRRHDRLARARAARAPPERPQDRLQPVALTNQLILAGELLAERRSVRARAS